MNDIIEVPIFVSTSSNGSIISYIVWPRDHVTEDFISYNKALHSNFESTLDYPDNSASHSSKSIFPFDPILRLGLNPQSAEILVLMKTFLPVL